MAERRVFFVVEYLPFAYSQDFRDQHYQRSREQFDARLGSKPWASSLQARLEAILPGDDYELTFFDLDTVQNKAAGLLPLVDLGIEEGAGAVVIADFPGVEALRSPIHRYWGTVKFTDVSDDELNNRIRCLIRGLFYPCSEQKNSVAESPAAAGAAAGGTVDEVASAVVDGAIDPRLCEALIGRSFAEMEADRGSYILGPFRWKAWALRDSPGAEGNPFLFFVGNGAGGGDR